MARAKQIKGIDCNGPAVTGIRTALSTRFGEMVSWRNKAVRWKDPEGVHSMRVASRRLRSALGDFTPYVNKRHLSSIVKQLKSLADGLGDVRDQDVAITALEELASRIPTNFSTTFEDLIQERTKIRSEARRELRKFLDKDQMNELASDFDKATELATEIKGQKEESHRYKRVAAAIIRDRLKEFEELSVSFYNPLDDVKLHDMRIAGKRLRYAIELFEPCWTANISSFAKEAAALQSALGRLHDCDVWIQSFRKPILTSKRSKQEDVHETYLWLFNHFNTLRNTYFEEAFSLWKQWESERVSSQLRQALKKR